MTTSSKDRQRKWKEKQRSEGKKPVTVMLSEKAYEILETETEKTKENQQTVIERAILNLQTVTSSTPVDKPIVTSNIPEGKIPVTGTAKEYKKGIYELIVNLHDTEELSFGEISRRFNNEGLQTLSGKGIWHPKTISKMHKRLKEA